MEISYLARRYLSTNFKMTSAHSDWMLLMSKESGFEIQFRISLNQKLDLPVFEDWYSSLIRIASLKGPFVAQSDLRLMHIWFLKSRPPF